MVDRAFKNAFNSIVVPFTSGKFLILNCLISSI